MANVRITSEYGKTGGEVTIDGNRVQNVNRVNISMTVNAIPQVDIGLVPELIDIQSAACGRFVMIEGKRYNLVEANE